MQFVAKSSSLGGVLYVCGLRYVIVETLQLLLHIADTTTNRYRYRYRPITHRYSPVLATASTEQPGRCTVRRWMELVPRKTFRDSALRS